MDNNQATAQTGNNAENCEHPGDEDLPDLRQEYINCGGHGSSNQPPHQPGTPNRSTGSLNTLSVSRVEETSRAKWIEECLGRKY